ncbi:hypothetical protein N7449_006671 [Penicillium cf. viridicatum]|uniref:Uncharacterized protein n=1 Tax=Penicillium cf. viridicatum TaxID=2972119 RepID=A0A9W9MDE6_9EURO|nr:hypothetical protein N7449_006671 [Penicillium cf. viridicatum]
MAISTGPTSILMSYAAGLWLESASGDLTPVDAGFVTKLGAFAVAFGHLRFNTPIGTIGDVVLLGSNGTLVSVDGVKVALSAGGVASGLAGGQLDFCS